MVSNRTLIFSKVPEGIPVPGIDIKVVDRPLDIDIPPTGGFVAEVLYSSFDPYLRHRLVNAAGARDFPPFDLGAPITNGAVINVLRADPTSSFRAGDKLTGLVPIAEYVSVTAKDSNEFRPIHNPLGLDLKLFLGPLGLPGLTAYSALYEIAKPKSGEVIFISAASGAVGQMVGQLAMREGLTVIGSVGSAEKLDILKGQLGFQEGFNYKKVCVLTELKRLAPKGIDSMAA